MGDPDPSACQESQILLFTFQTFPCSLMKSFTGPQGVPSVWTAPFYVPNIIAEALLGTRPLMYTSLSTLNHFSAQVTARKKE